MEDRNVLGVFRSRAAGKRRRSSKCWLLLVKEKLPDKVIEVYLTNVCTKCLERGARVLRG